MDCLTQAESIFIRIARCNHPWFIHGELSQLAAKEKRLEQVGSIRTVLGKFSMC